MEAKSKKELLKQLQGEYYAIIEKDKPNLSSSSIQQYSRSLKKLYDIMVKNPDYNSTKLDFLKNRENVKKAIENYSPSTIRNYYTAIITILDTETNRDKATIRHYENIVKSFNTQYKDDNMNKEISEKQKPNFIKPEEVLELISRLQTAYSETDDEQKRQNLEMGILAYKILYHHPIRNELATLQTIPLKEYKKLTEEEKEKNNYLVVGTKRIFMARYGFKTDKKKEYLNIQINIEDKGLKRDIFRYIKKLTNNEVFPLLSKKQEDKKMDKTDRDNYKKNALSTLLITLSKKYINKKLSTTILAKILLSHKHYDTVKSLEKDAKSRGHSVATQSLVYIKKPIE
jgi:hypothetical protein